MNMLVTGSWDKTVKYWDLRSPNAVHTQQMPERVYAMDVVDELMVVGTADRQIQVGRGRAGRGRRAGGGPNRGPYGSRQARSTATVQCCLLSRARCRGAPTAARGPPCPQVFNLSNPGAVYKSLQSPLKYQTRCIACFPDKSGYLLGSIEGRVAVHHVEDNMQGKNFTFKCHRCAAPPPAGGPTMPLPLPVQRGPGPRLPRQPARAPRQRCPCLAPASPLCHHPSDAHHPAAAPSSPAARRDGNDVYAVNSMSFHPQFGTFVTAGSDGAYNFWDKDSKQRLKAMAKCSMPIPCGDFNRCRAGRPGMASLWSSSGRAAGSQQAARAAPCLLAGSAAFCLTPVLTLPACGPSLLLPPVL